MSQFLERNKRKGLLSILLLFFQRGKGGGPLLLMVGLLAFVFILPASTIMNSPFAQRVASALGLRSELGGGDMMVAGGGLRNSLDMDGQLRKGLADPGALFAGAGAEARYGKSTVDFVKDGGVSDKSKSETVEKLAQEGKNVDSVLRPEDAKEMKDGVPLSNDELIGGLMKNADAAGMATQAGLAGQGGTLAESGFSLGVGGKGSLSSGARAADPAAGLLAKSMSSANVPGVAGRTRGASTGKMSWREFRKLNANVSSAVGSSKTSGKSTAMYQLAEGRAYSVAAAPPPGKCDPNNCPGEYASNAGGAVFDGGKPKGSILSAPELGDVGTPQLPNEGEVGDMIDEANQLEEDSKKCEEANNHWGPIIDDDNAQMQKKSDELNAMDCNGGGCSSEKARKCQAKGDEMRAVCNKYNQDAQAWSAACPLTEGRFNAMNCNQ